MANKTLPLKEISINELYNSSNKVIYEVPIYQRNYAWEKDEIATLIQDTYDAYENYVTKYGKKNREKKRKEIGEERKEEGKRKEGKRMHER